jgi:DNA-binding XRE family transcriptional regulator
VSSTLEQVNPKLPTQRQRRQLREAAGLSRSNLATIVGVSPESIYNWEKGGEPQGLHRRAYAAALSELDAIATEEAAGWANDS